MVYKKKIDHVGKRHHRVSCLIWEGRIGCSPLIGRYRISGAMSAWMDVDSKGHCQFIYHRHIGAVIAGGHAGSCVALGGCNDITGGGCAGAGGHCTMDADCNAIIQMLMLVSCFCTLGSSPIAGGRAGC